jgi:hypothetical protein
LFKENFNQLILSLSIGSIFDPTILSWFHDGGPPIREYASAAASRLGAAMLHRG